MVVIMMTYFHPATTTTTWCWVVVNFLIKNVIAMAVLNSFYIIIIKFSNIGYIVLLLLLFVFQV